MKDIKVASMLPLIGGFSFATKDVFGKDEEFLLSYPGFHGNEKHLLHNKPHLKDKYLTLDEESNWFCSPEDEKKFIEMNKDIDIVTGIPICSGLSLLNCSTNKDSGKSRGGDAEQNNYMYIMADFILKNIQPSVYVFENAPNLYTKAGEIVANKLLEYSKKYNYSFSLLKTSTIHHGAPQNRSRTFGFFWKSDKAPLLEYTKVNYKNLTEFFKEIPKDVLYHNKEEAKEQFENDNWLKFLKHKGENETSVKEFKNNTSVINYIYDSGYLDEAIEYFEKMGESAKTHLRVAKHIKYKISIGKGFWDGTPIMVNEYTNAIISKNMMRYILKDNFKRFITYREAMHLMGFPHDFEFDGKAKREIFKITQNVPIYPAKYVLEQCKKFINNELEFSNSSHIKQRINGEIIKTEYSEEIKTHSFTDLL